MMKNTQSEAKSCNFGEKLLGSDRFSQSYGLRLD